MKKLVLLVAFVVLALCACSQYPNNYSVRVSNQTEDKTLDVGLGAMFEDIAPRTITEYANVELNRLTVVTSFFIREAETGRVVSGAHQVRQGHQYTVFISGPVFNEYQWRIIDDGKTY